MLANLRWWSRAGGLLLATSLSGCLASGVEVELLAAAFAPGLRGDAGLESSGGGGFSNIDLRSDLGLDDREIEPYARADINLFGFALGASAFETSQSADGNLSASFGDLAAGTAVNTDLDLQVLHGTLTFDLINFSVIRIAPGIGVNYYDLDLELTDSFGNVEDIDAEGPLPLAVVQAEIDPLLLPVTLRVDAGGIVGDYGDFDGFVLDIESSLRWQALPYLEVYGGHRFMRFDVEGTTDGQDFEGDFDLSGFFLGAGLHF